MLFHLSVAHSNCVVYFFFINRGDTLSNFSRIIVGTSPQEERLRFSDSKTQLLFLEPKNIFIAFTTPFIFLSLRRRIPPGGTSLAAESKEKRLYSQVRIIENYG